MINSIRFTFGRSASADPLVFDPRPITVFVGPNNSGKSLALREIETWCKVGPQHPGAQQPRKIVDQIDVELPDADQALTELEPFIHAKNLLLVRNCCSPDHCVIGRMETSSRTVANLRDALLV